MHSAENRKESRGAHAREDFPDRDDQTLAEALPLLGGAKGGTVDYRKVQLNTLTDEVASIPPKARTY